MPLTLPHLTRLLPTERQVIEAYQQSAPVDVAGLARAFGIAVWEDDLPLRISGKIQRDPMNGGSTGYSIVVNSKEGFRRKRFTIAHETAHYLLHRASIGASVEDDVLYRSQLSNSMEVEANRLAADLLMPYSLIQQAQENGIRDISGLADLFKVSTAAMAIRLGIPQP